MRIALLLTSLLLAVFLAACGSESPTAPAPTQRPTDTPAPTLLPTPTPAPATVAAPTAVPMPTAEPEPDEERQGETQRPPRPRSRAILLRAGC